MRGQCQRRIGRNRLEMARFRRIHPTSHISVAAEIRLNSLALLLPSGCGLDQLPHLGQGFPRLIASLLRDVGVKEVFPESAVSPQVDDHGLPSTAGIDHKLDAWDFLQ